MKRELIEIMQPPLLEQLCFQLSFPERKNHWD